MISRILPIIAFLVAAIAGYLLYASGSLTQAFRPSVNVVLAERPFFEGQDFQIANLRIVPISISDVPQGAITLSRNATKQNLEQLFAGQKVGRPIKKGDVIVSDMLGSSARTYAFTTTVPVAQGERLSLDNLTPTLLMTVPQPGTIQFKTEEEAFAYFQEGLNFQASKPLAQGQIITASEIGNGGELVFVLRAQRGFSIGESLSIDGIEVVGVAASEVSRGAITFPERVAADIFLTQSFAYAVSRPVSKGDQFSMDNLLSGGQQTEIDSENLPKTLAELSAYTQAYPDSVVLVQDSNFVGALPEAGELVDVWIEGERTDGAFGEIELVRIASGLLVREVVDVAAEEAASDAASVDPATAGADPMPDMAAGEDGSTSGGAAEFSEPVKRLWILTPQDVTRKFEEFRRNDRIAYMIRASSVAVEQIGNGTTCLEDICSANRDASEDLAALVAEISGDDLDVEGKVLANDPLQIIDGVSPQLETRLLSAGFATFRSIADWEDAQIATLVFSLDISNNLAVYIRQQARILVGAPTEARRSLGLTEKPQQ